MEHSKSKLLSVCLAIAVGILTVCLLLFLPLRSTTALNISFLGTTNDPVVGPKFSLIVSNASDYEIRVWNCSPEIKTNGSWVRLHSGKIVQLPNLPPHSARSFTVAAVPSGSTWRIPALWAYEKPFSIEFARRYLIDNVNLNVRRLSNGQSPGLNGGNHLQLRLIYSAEMKN